MLIEDSSSTFLPSFSNLNPINDTCHPVKTGQNRPPLQRSASLSQAVDSPECWWGGKLTDTKVAISDSDRCLLESVEELGFNAPGVQSSSFSSYVTVCEVFCFMSLHVQLYTNQAQQLTRPSLHRGVAQRRTDQCTVKRVDYSAGQPALFCCYCFVSGHINPNWTHLDSSLFAN